MNTNKMQLLLYLFNNKPFIKLLEDGEATIIPSKGVMVFAGWQKIQDYLENIQTKEFDDEHIETGGFYDGLYFYILNKKHDNKK